MSEGRNNRGRRASDHHSDSNQKLSDMMVYVLNNAAHIFGCYDKNRAKSRALNGEIVTVFSRLRHFLTFGVEYERYLNIMVLTC